jgi:hypothetical protein
MTVSNMGNAQARWRPDQRSTCSDVAAPKLLVARAFRRSDPNRVQPRSFGMSGTAAFGMLLAMLSSEPVGEVELEHNWFTARLRIGNTDGELVPDGFLISELTATANVSEALDVELQVHNTIDEDWREAQLAEANKLYDGHGMPVTAMLTATYSY